MLAVLQQLFNDASSDTSASVSLTQQQRQLASAALLVEVATIDQHFDSDELAALSQHLQQQFQLDTEAIDALINEAKSASKSSSSLYEFTQLINRHCDDKEKYQLALGLWSIAYADGNLDKYEEHIIRRIADLIHLRHSEFIRAKHEVRDQG